jgi:hypothetical protein
MRLLSRLDDERKSGAIWYAIFRQSPYGEDSGPRALKVWPLPSSGDSIPTTARAMAYNRRAI